MLKLQASDINRVFEMVDDNDIEGFDAFFLEFKESKKQILRTTDSNNRTLLHQACQKGRVQIVR